jgi:glyoxylate/hydroxypyruvate reductase A
MGQATAKQLLAMGYKVSGWSRSSSSHSQCAAAGMTCYAGQQQLEAFVRAQDVVVCLLPLTQETTGGGSNRDVVFFCSAALLVGALGVCVPTAVSCCIISC